jgi:hypothetical protein
MSRMKLAVAGVLLAGLVSSVSLAAAPKTYQVTGPVLAVSDESIIVQKGKDKWEILRSPSTKINGDLKVGSHVSIQYTMTAVSVDVRAPKAQKPTAKSKG